MTTLDTIAQLAGVSRTTASYVISGKADKYRISQRTQQKVLDIAAQYDYQPDHAAASLRRGQTNTIGMVIPDLENASYARLAMLMEQQARNAGFQLVITCSDDDPDTEQTVVKLLQRRKIDALVVASSLGSDSIVYHTIQNLGIPVISIDRAMDERHFISVISEDQNGARELASALLESAPESIGFISAAPELDISRKREHGFMEAIKHHGPSITMSLEYGSHFSQVSARDIVNNWVKNNNVPDAILTTSFVLFEGVLDVLRDHPTIMSRIKLATFGDNRLLDFLPFGVHSLPQQLDKVACLAMSKTLNAINGEYVPGVHVIPRLKKWRFC